MRPQAATLAAGLGLTPEDGDAAAEMVTRTLAHPLLVAARAAPRVYRELPITALVNGQLISAQLDLVYGSPGAWQIVEYKTDAALGASGEYQSQLALYQQAFAIVAQRSTRASLLFLASGEQISSDKGTSA